MPGEAGGSSRRGMTSTFTSGSSSVFTVAKGGSSAYVSSRHGSPMIYGSGVSPNDSRIADTACFLTSTYSISIFIASAPATPLVMSIAAPVIGFSVIHRCVGISRPIWALRAPPFGNENHRAQIAKRSISTRRRACQHPCAGAHGRASMTVLN